MSPIFRNLGKIPEETAHVLQNLVSAQTGVFKCYQNTMSTKGTMTGVMLLHECSK